MSTLKWLLVAVLAVGIGLAASPALAQAEGDEAGGGDGPTETIYKKTTIIDFSDVTITGELTKPEGSYLMNKKKANFNLLIRVRDNFLPEMIKSVDNL